MSGTDEDWEWQSCGSELESANESTGTHRRGSGRSRVPTSVVNKVNAVISSQQAITEHLALQYAETLKWRVVSVVMMVLQLLQLIPASARDLAVEKVSGVLTLQNLAWLVIAHLVQTCVRKFVTAIRNKGLLRRSSQLDTSIGFTAPPRARVTVVEAARPAPVVAAPSAAAAATKATPQDTPQEAQLEAPAAPAFPKQRFRQGIANAQLDAHISRLAASMETYPDVGDFEQLGRSQKALLHLLFVEKQWNMQQETRISKYMSLDCDWNGGHTASRFEGLLKCSARFYIHEMIDESPKAQKAYDPLFENYQTVEDGGSEGGRVLYLSFQTPVTFVQQRDVCMFAERAMLTDAEIAYFKIDELMANLRTTHGLTAPTDIEPLSSRYDFSGPVRRPMCLATHSIDHKNVPVNSKYERGHMNLQGYLLLPLDDEHCYVMEIVGMDPRGQLPAWAVAVCAFVLTNCFF